MMFLICIRFGSYEVRRLTRALVVGLRCGGRGIGGEDGEEGGKEVGKTVYLRRLRQRLPLNKGKAAVEMF